MDQTGSPRRRFLNEGSGTVLQFKDSFVLQLPVRAHNRIGVHDQILGQLADGRELIALTESAGFDRVLHLLHELEIKGSARRLIEPKDHRDVY
jgi:hypothetical protein